MAPFKVIIIGGGLAGSLLANGLSQHGIDFMVYERDAKDSTTRDGYQIRLGVSAMIGFRACLRKAQIDELMLKFGRSGGMLLSAPMYMDSKFNTLLDMRKFPAFTKSAPINRVVLRDTLAKPIYESGRLQYGKNYVRYEIREKGKPVRVFFADGTEDECDLLIAADGSSSKINAEVGLNNIVPFKEKWNFLGKSMLPREKLLALAPECRRSPLLCTKDGNIFFFSAYLPELKKDSERDAGADYDENAASAFFGLTIPTAYLPEGGPSAIVNKREFCANVIKDWDPRYLETLKLIDNEDAIHVFQGRASVEPKANWRQTAKTATDPKRGNNHVWLMGDAVHPMFPLRGMGANQAMHDTAEILPLIRELHSISQAGHEPTENDFAVAVKQYESMAFPRAFGWVRQSGGTEMSMPDFSGVSGGILRFFVSRVLDLTYWFTVVRRWFGWKPKDDAPEFRD